MKREVFRELRGVVQPGCVLATNTSSLSVAEMGADVGIHFFNPVALLPLVELVRTDETTDEALATAWAFAAQPAQAPGARPRCPRVRRQPRAHAPDGGRPGRARARQHAGRSRRGDPPARPADGAVGAAPDGRPARREPRPRRPSTPPTRTASRSRRPCRTTPRATDEIAVREHDPRTPEQILDQALDAIADEIHHLLEEGVVAEAADVDTALLLGAGWPFWLGGITRYLDQTGRSERMFGRNFA